MRPGTGPNLARRPFANARPVRRLAALLWTLALVLVGWNAYAYLSSGAGAAARAAELERLRDESVATRARIETLEADLRRADLVRLNLRTEYLNQRIAERAFSWNRLLDHLVEAMPRLVRVVRLAPEGFRDDGSTRTGRTPSAAERRVNLRLSGEAGDGEALLDFVDRLFAHPAFDTPNLASEARTRAGNLDFELSVGYWPAGRPELSGRESFEAAAAATGSAAVPPASPVAEPPEPERPAVAPARAGAGAAALESRSAAAASAPAVAEPGVPAPASMRAAAAAPEAAAAATAPPPAAGAATTEQRPAPAPAAAPELSIFGVPLAAKPYASGGGR